MDATLFPEWNSEVGIEFPLPIQRKSLGLDNELVELLWQNGDVVLQTQNNNRKQSHDPSWMDCPIDVSFEKEFCANISPEIPPVLSPRRRLCPEAFEAGKAARDVVQERAFSGVEWGGAPECSAKTIGSSNRVANEVFARRVGPPRESTETGTLERVITSSCRGSDSTCWKTGSLSNDTNKHKRKSRDIGDSECRSDATELDSATGNKPSSQKSRRSRVAEVHNMSERRRRDRINEKMKALQELIPHSNKSDKASMLDEAIEYMKSLQLQLQLLWMGSGMAHMMLPGMHPYMARMGMLPTTQNLMRLSRFPLVDPAMAMPSMNYQNRMQNPSFSEQYANYMAFNLMANSPQPMNLFNYGPQSGQQNQTIAPQPDSNQSIG